MSRRCHGPWTDPETGVAECRLGGELDAPCPSCEGAGLVPHLLLGIPTRARRTCPACEGPGVVDACTLCEARV